MPDTVKERGNLLDAKGVRWTEEDWERINRAASILWQRDHRETDATDIIRMGTRRFVNEILASADATQPAA
jgi:hypothetical protein